MGDRDIATVKAPRFPRRHKPPEPPEPVLDRRLWPHNYIGPNMAILGPCVIKQRWAGAGYIIRSRRDGKLYTVPREHVQYYAKEASEV